MKTWLKEARAGAPEVACTDTLPAPSVSVKSMPVSMSWQIEARKYMSSLTMPSGQPCLLMVTSTRWAGPSWEMKASHQYIRPPETFTVPPYSKTLRS